MSARQWLRRHLEIDSGKSFGIPARDGGIAGSLVGLGFLVRKISKAGVSTYRITMHGARWLGLPYSEMWRFI
jgi:hypothetical protein